MTVEEARNLIDLFLDDDLPMELASEFKHVMFENDELRSEVASLRQARESLWIAYEGDAMSEDERCRVLGRILAEAAAASSPKSIESPAQLRLPLKKET